LSKIGVQIFPHNVLDVFHKWHEDIKAQDDLTPEDKELLMILSPAYEKSRTQALLEGMLKGQQQTQYLFVKS
jgi:hypothetical protein